ncbi:MAG TPA: hypothetical protein VIH26_11350 [Anaerolineales bacterium]
MNPQGFAALLRVGLPAGLFAGVLMGVVARASMRAFAITEGQTPSFSIGGTLTVIAVFALVLGAPLALLYVRFWRPLGIAPGWHGLAFGAAVLLVLIAIPFLVIPSDEANLRTRLVAIAVFVPVPLLYGWLLGLTVERLIARA